MLQVIELVLKPGPELLAKTLCVKSGETAWQAVTSNAVAHVHCPIQFEGATLRDVVELVAANALFVTLAGHQGEYIARCVDSALEQPSPTRNRYEPPAGARLVLSSSIALDSTTRAISTTPQMYLHGEYPSDDYSFSDFGLLGLHIQDLLDLPICYEPSVMLLEADYGKLRHEHSLGRVIRPAPTLLEGVLGCFQEFTYRDTPKRLDNDEFYEAQDVASTGEVHADIQRMFEQPYPEPAAHRSILNAVLFYVNDSEPLEEGLQRTHPEVEMMLNEEFKQLTGYQARRKLLAPCT